MMVEVEGLGSEGRAVAVAGADEGVVAVKGAAGRDCRRGSRG
jgi:hypothetical protein